MAERTPGPFRSQAEEVAAGIIDEIGLRRRQLRLSQAVLAGVLGTTQGDVSETLSGRTKNPGVVRVAEMALVTGAHLGLLGDDIRYATTIDPPQLGASQSFHRRTEPCALSDSLVRAVDAPAFYTDCALLPVPVVVIRPRAETS